MDAEIERCHGENSDAIKRQVRNLEETESVTRKVCTRI